MLTSSAASLAPPVRLNPDLRLQLSDKESDTQAEANQGLRLFPGDRLLMCSDGLTDLVQDAEILDILKTTLLDDSPAHLIELANQRGGHDNITVVLMEVPLPAHITQPVRVAPAPVVVPAQNPLPINRFVGDDLFASHSHPVDGNLIGLFAYSFVTFKRCPPVLSIHQC